MCIMTSTKSNIHNGEARIALLKQLLKDASPKNPTYILGRIIADFRARSSTELAVRKGEEVFVLFEINDWAFATLLSDTNSKGYVPLDYCDVIRDFYEMPTSGHSSHTQTRCSRNSKDEVIAKGQVTPKKVQFKAETNTKELHYYETKVKQRSTCRRSSATEHRRDSFHKVERHADNFYKIEHGVDNFSSTYNHHGCDLSNDECEHSTSGCGELYAEQTTPLRSRHLNRKTDCCCCCEKRKCRSSREERYDHVLHYLIGSQQTESHCDDSESGLGDSESIVSFSEPHVDKGHVDLSDMSTQTSQSLENLQKQLELMSVDLDLAATELDINRMPKENIDNVCERHRTNNHSMTSSQPSLDSLLTDPVATTHIPKSFLAEADDTDEGSSTSFDKEYYNTVKRRSSKTTTDEVSSSESSKEEMSGKQSTSDESSLRSSPDIGQSAQSKNSSWKTLSLPILEKGKIPNRVELNQLSTRIKDKLKPTRDELLQCRSKEQSSTISETSRSSSRRSSVIPTQLTITSDTRSSESLDSPSTPHTVEIKQRKMTLQAIQEQYMKLEEARLLHNALKHLNDTMHAGELNNTSKSS